jgi:hypothetical protein
VSSSGLIYAAIAIMWAAVLIPMWLRNHDTAAENRSAERFGQAMRVLSRKEGRDRAEAGDRAPSGETAEVGKPGTGARPQQRAQRRVKQRVPQRVAGSRKPRPPRTLAQRRARTLGVLAALVLVTAVTAMVSPVSWWAVAPAAVLLIAFVVHLRIQARQRDASRSRRAAGRTTRPEQRRQPAEQVEAQASASGAREESVAPTWSTVVQGPSRAVVLEKKGEPAAEAEGEGEGEWKPNPLPLPTYVTAPKAMRPIKVIDLTTPGAWSSGRLLDDDLAEEDLLAAQVADDELDALIEQEASGEPAADTDEGDRRAVGD